MIKITTAVLLAAVVLAGCGDDQDTGPGVPPRDPPAAPKPAAGPADVVAGLSAAVSARKCKALAQLLHSSYGTRRTKFCRDLRRQLATLPAGAPVKRYGTGAVAEFQNAGGGPRALVLALDSNRRYRTIFLSEGGPVANTPTLKAQADRVARASLRSIETGNCPGFLRVADRRSGIGDAPREEVCVALANLAIVPYLQSDPAAAPEPQGGDGRLAFYLVRAGRAGSPFRGAFTMILRRTPGNPPGQWKFVTVVPS